MEVEIDDPYEPGAKIATVRSVRDDPLADQLARGNIDQAQFEAGRQFQADFQTVERGPRAVQITEAVDGNPPQEFLTDTALKASKRLSRCYQALGVDGTALVHSVLVHSMTFKQISAARGLTGQPWDRYWSKRLDEALNRLAIVYGFSNGENKSSAGT